MKLVKAVNDCEKTTGDGNSALVACYPDHRASLKLHADNEHEQINQSSSICSFSIGANRVIDFIPNRKNNSPLSIDMKHNSLVIMKPGCQQIMRHKVDPGPVPPDNNISPVWRFSISIRKCLHDNDIDKDNSAQLNSSSHVPAKSSSPVKSLIQSFENATSATVKKISPTQSTTAVAPQFSRPCTLIAGDSFVTPLKSNLLGKGKKSVFNISKGGQKISQVEKSIETFYLSQSDMFVEKVFLSVGTNDIRNCFNGVKHLRSPLTQLVKKVNSIHAVFTSSTS